MGPMSPVILVTRRPSSPKRDARSADLDLGVADPRSGEQIVDQRLGDLVVLELVPLGGRAGGMRGLDVLERHEVAAQELLVAHRAIAVLLLQLADRRLR